MENRAEGVSFRKKVAIRQVGDAVRTDESFTGTQEMADNSFLKIQRVNEQQQRYLSEDES